MSILAKTFFDIKPYFHALIGPKRLGKPSQFTPIRAFLVLDYLLYLLLQGYNILY